MQKNHSVADFYAKKSVFITGGSGFLGKVVLEKLLYSCPDIKNVFVLIRNKKGVDADSRIKNMIESTAFRRLRNEKPDSLKKIIPILGDLSSSNLGIKPEDEEMLKEKVSIVIHSAATVKFNEPLKVALQMNLDGTRKLLALCHKMKKIEVLVHVSTAYTKTDTPGKVIDETIYPPPIELNELASFLNKYGDDEQKTLELTRGFPNSYTFSKALADTLIVQNHGNIPTVIIKPAIVTPSYEEPESGWTDNWYGATGIVTVLAKGIGHYMSTTSSTVLDLIPVDYVSNCIIAAPTRCQSTKEVSVYNVSTSTVNPIKLVDFSNTFIDIGLKNNFNDAPFPKVIYTKNKILIFLVYCLFEVLPAFLVDFWMYIQGKKPFYLKSVSQAVFVRDSIQYFTKNSWSIKCENTRKLMGSLSQHDREQFNFDPININWKEYINVYVLGVKKYLLDKSNK